MGRICGRACRRAARPSGVHLAAAEAAGSTTAEERAAARRSTRARRPRSTGWSTTEGRSSSARHGLPSASPAPTSLGASRMRAPALAALPAESTVSWTRSRRSVSRKVALAAPFGGRYIDAVVFARERRDRGRLAGDERPGGHRGGQLAVEAEHELLRPVVVGEEPGNVESVDLIRPRGRKWRSKPVEGVRAGTDESEQARAVAKEVAEGSLRLGTPRGEETGCERVWRHQIPVAAGSRSRSRSHTARSPSRSRTGMKSEPSDNHV